MRKFSLLIFAFVTAISFTTLLSADDYGLGREVDFYIQSALDNPRSNNGFWDIPGNGRQTYKNGATVQVWTFESQKDRLYKFIPRGRDQYIIRCQNGKYVNASHGHNGAKLFLDSRPYTFRMKYTGGGRWKIFAQDGRVVTLPNRSSKRGHNLHLWDDHNGPWMEWALIQQRNGRNYRFYPRQTASSAPVQQNNVSSNSGRLDAALNDTGGNYFSVVNYGDFRRDNQGGKMVNYLNSLTKKNDQWKKILDIANDVSKNRNNVVKLMVLGQLSSVNVLKADGFLEKVAVKAYQKRLGQLAARERHSTAKRYLENIKNKF